MVIYDVSYTKHSGIEVFIFKVFENGANRLDIKMSGKLDAEAMKVALDELISKSENIKNGKMLCNH